MLLEPEQVVFDLNLQGLLGVNIKKKKKKRSKYPGIGAG